MLQSSTQWPHDYCVRQYARVHKKYVFDYIHTVCDTPVCVNPIISNGLLWTRKLTTQYCLINSTSFWIQDIKWHKRQINIFLIILINHFFSLQKIVCSTIKNRNLDRAFFQGYSWVLYKTLMFVMQVRRALKKAAPKINFICILARRKVSLRKSVVRLHHIIYFYFCTTTTKIDLFIYTLFYKM